MHTSIITSIVQCLYHLQVWQLHQREARFTAEDATQVHQLPKQIPIAAEEQHLPWEDAVTFHLSLPSH